LDQNIKAQVFDKVDKFLKEKSDIMNQKGWFEAENEVQDFLNELGTFLLDRIQKDVTEPTTEDMIEIEKKTTNTKTQSL
jgi:hypothetical protein